MREARDFERSLEEFRKADVAVVGASTDPPQANARFAANQELHFPLLSDVGGHAVQALGIRSERGTARRCSFLIDSEGIVRQIWDPVRIDGHAAAVLAAARSLR